MDIQTNPPGTPTPKPNVPEATSSSLSSTTPIIVAIVVVFVLGSAAAIYFKGHWPSMTSSNATTTPATQNDTGIAWQSLVGEKPTTTLTGTSTYDGSYAYSYDAYSIGTYTKGQYTGSQLYIAKETYKGAPTDTIDTYVYYIGDSAGKPIAWWGYPGASWYGMGDIEFPSSLSNAPQLASTTLPIKTTGYGRIFDSGRAASVMGSDLIVPSNPATFKPIGSTINGELVVKTLVKPSGVAFNDLQQYSYYSQTPFGAFYPLTLEPNFIDQNSYNSPAGLTWQTGSTTVATYNYGHYLYGVSDCFTSFKNTASLIATFIQTGTTNNGDAVYEINPKGNDDVYRCLYPKTQRYTYDPTTQASSSYYPTTYQEFLATHPIFFWKHPYGEWMAFGRSDVVPAAEKAKPVIYLYPTKTENVNVQVNPIGGFTKTDPAYGSGWNVSATPDSVLTDLQDGKTYPYLFWEGGRDGVVATPEEGFVVKQSDIPALLDRKLALFGLNEKEREDFVSFWTPRLSQTPYYFITFIPRSEIDRVAPLSITPQPDTVIRVLMDYRALQNPINVEPLQITSNARNGFTVVEWGGIIR